MPQDLYGESERKLRKEHGRLKSVAVSVATDEQIAKMRLTNEDAQPRAQLVVEWEPMSYRKEGGKYGNVETDYLPMSNNLDDGEVASVRNSFFRGIPSDKRFTIPKSVGEARRYWERWMIKAKMAGLRLEIGDDGQITSPDVGQVFEWDSGFDTFPQWIPNTDGKRGGHWSDGDKGEKVSSVYVRYPVGKTPDYIVPDDVPVRFVSSGDDDLATPVTSGATGAGGVSAEQLAAAFSEAGLIGADETDFDTAAKQVNVTYKFGGRAPVFFSTEISKAASEGTLLDLAVTKGAVKVDGGKILAAV